MSNVIETEKCEAFILAARKIWNVNQADVITLGELAIAQHALDENVRLRKGLAKLLSRAERLYEFECPLHFSNQKREDRWRLFKHAELEAREALNHQPKITEQP